MRPSGAAAANPQVFMLRSSPSIHRHRLVGSIAFALLLARMVHTLSADEATPVAKFLTLRVAATAPSEKRTLSIPAGPAATSLQMFAAQAQVELVFSIERVEDVRTQAVKGFFTPREGLDKLLANTGLIVIEDTRTGALSVHRTHENPPANRRPAPRAAPRRRFQRAGNGAHPIPIFSR